MGTENFGKRNKEWNVFKGCCGMKFLVLKRTYSSNFEIGMMG